MVLNALYVAPFGTGKRIKADLNVAIAMQRPQ